MAIVTLVTLNRPPAWSGCHFRIGDRRSFTGDASPFRFADGDLPLRRQSWRRVNNLHHRAASLKNVSQMRFWLKR